MMTESERARYLSLHQQVLPFEFWTQEEAEKKAKKDAELAEMPYYPEPINDNQKLFNLQRDYYGGRESALTEIFMILDDIAARLINIEMNVKAKTKRYFTQDVIDDMAMDATCLFINQIKKNHLIIRTSFVAYLRLQVLKVMNNRTKAQRFEQFCREHHVNIFYLSDEEKALFKLKFEEELLEEKAKAIKERQEENND